MRQWSHRRRYKFEGQGVVGNKHEYLQFCQCDEFIEGPPHMTQRQHVAMKSTREKRNKGQIGTIDDTGQDSRMNHGLAKYGFRAFARKGLFELLQP
mmetsp:Transcript_22387/g.33080  ORF Transcript_22387/g.33080 Transcript_22387/m.33080 type:complete len:96 (+) Transcript_22387:257-544(+)